MVFKRKACVFDFRHLPAKIQWPLTIDIAYYCRPAGIASTNPHAIMI